MSRWLLLVSTLALLLWAPSTAAQTPPEETFTLAMALRAMRAQHPALAAADGDLRAAAGDAVDAALWTNPTLSASWTPGLRNSSYDASGYTSVALTQFVELSGAPGARGRAADAITGASRLTRDDIARRLALDVESAMAHLVAAQRTHPRSLEPGRPASHHHHRVRCEGVRADVRVGGLVARAGVDNARDQRVAVVSHLADLVAQHARADLVGHAGSQLGH
jgi:hypothetical protein